jgi:segregation and condensation protein B
MTDTPTDPSQPPEGDHQPQGTEASDTPGSPVLVAEARRAIEAVLMVADEPIEPQLLAQLVELSAPRVEELCAEMAADYEREERGFVLARVAGGYRFQSHPDQAPYVERFVLDGQSARLSAAALETLAIVAYKQPVSRAQVAAIRGVSVDGVMRTLQQRGYIDEIGRDPGPGQAVLFGTTQTFLERLGLDSLAELPPLGDFVPGADVVEALEHGLRVDPVVTHDPVAPIEPGSDDEAAAAPPTAGSE